MKTIMYAFILVAVVACDDGGSDPAGSRSPAATAYTDADTYLSGDLITFYVKNATEEPLSIEACDGHMFYLRDRLHNSEWQLWVTYLCSSTPPSELRDVPVDSVIHNSLSVSKTGYYRLRLPFVWNHDPERRDTLVTNTFLVTVNEAGKASDPPNGLRMVK